MICDGHKQTHIKIDCAQHYIYTMCSTIYRCLCHNHNHIWRKLYYIYLSTNMSTPHHQRPNQTPNNFLSPSTRKACRDQTTVTWQSRAKQHICTHIFFYTETEISNVCVYVRICVYGTPFIRDDGRIIFLFGFNFMFDPLYAAVARTRQGIQLNGANRVKMYQLIDNRTTPIDHHRSIGRSIACCLHVFGFRTTGFR